MIADIKTALPELPAPCDFAYVQGFKGSEYRRLSGYEPKSAMYSPDQMRAYAERAVLEAAPASTAVAMIDAALAEASDYHDLRARLIALLAAPASSTSAQAVDAATALDLFEAEQQRILSLDPRERAMQHNYSRTMTVCYEFREFIRKLQSQQSPVQASDAGRPKAKVDWPLCDKFVPFDDNEKYCSTCGWSLRMHAKPQPDQPAQEENT